MLFAPWSRRALAFAVLIPGGVGPPLHAQSTAALKTNRVGCGISRPDSAQAQARHYLVLVSLDGFRWDYAQREGAAHLLALGKMGAWAPEGVLPSYPALGAPNRFTIVTGLYPGHHGLVADNFYDPERKERFSADEPKQADDGSWYRGVPLWGVAQSQGMCAAVVGWPGSNARIAGFLPSYSIAQGGDYGARLKQISHWLHLPAPERPHFIAIDSSE